MTDQLNRSRGEPTPSPAFGGAPSEEWHGSAPGSARLPARFSAFVISPAVAVLYAFLGLLALNVGQLTGLAAPVWPAAGLALAATLCWRWRALPGVFVGSLTGNVLWLTHTGQTDSGPLLVSAAIGIGAVLEAAAGAYLIDRFVGPIRRLDTPRAVMLTLALGGLLATTIAPTIGVATQLATGLLSTGQALIGWLTWWVGDAIGVIVFAPLVLMLRPSQAKYWSGRRWKIAVPSLLIVGILLTAIVQNVTNDRARIDTAVRQLGSEAADDLASDLALHQEVLEGVRGLVDASEFVAVDEFRTYTQDALERLPSLQALSWNPVVTQKGLAAFVARQRAQPGLENFTVTQRDSAGKPIPVSPRAEYVVVAYIEPIAKNRGALGFDIDSSPVRAAAIDVARDTGRPTATTPVDLVQGPDKQKGMLALLPVYEGGADPGNERERRAHCAASPSGSTVSGICSPSRSGARTGTTSRSPSPT